MGSATDFGEAATQLGINLAGILVAAAATLILQRALWRRVPTTVPRVGRFSRARG
jgi:hypothetical protein